MGNPRRLCANRIDRTHTRRSVHGVRTIRSEWSTTDGSLLSFNFKLLQMIELISQIVFSPSKIGADVVVAFYDTVSRVFRAEDYYLSHLSQCDGKHGVCPDERIGGRNDVTVGAYRINFSHFDNNRYSMHKSSIMVCVCV